MFQQRPMLPDMNGMTFTVNVPAVLSAMQLLGASYLPVEPGHTAKKSDFNGIIFAAPRAQP
jgi:hypothetical protein